MAGGAAQRWPQDVLGNVGGFVSESQGPGMLGEVVEQRYQRLDRGVVAGPVPSVVGEFPDALVEQLGGNIGIGELQAVCRRWLAGTGYGPSLSQAAVGLQPSRAGDDVVNP